MPQTTIGFGIVLILLGLGGYFGSGMASPTALIPSIFGVLLAILGGIAMKGGNVRKHAMHVAAMVGLIGIIGVLPRLIPALMKQIQGSEEAPAPMALASQILMFLLCAIFVGLCVRSFIQARKQQKAEAAGASQ